MVMTTAQLVPNSPCPLVPPPPIATTITTISSHKPGAVSTLVGQQQPLPVDPLGLLSVGQQQPPIDPLRLPSGAQQPPPIDPLGLPSVGQHQSVDQQGLPSVGQHPVDQLVVSTMGQQQPPTNTLGMPTMGQQHLPANTLGIPPVGQQHPASNTLCVSSVGQQHPPTNTLSMPTVGQQQSLSTLGATPMGQPPSISTLGVTPIGQTQSITTLSMSPVGQQQPTNLLGPAPAAQQSTSTMGAGTIGGMIKPVSIHSAVPTLPGYNFATAGGLQQRFLLSPDMQARLPSGEVVSIGQLASLANRPLQNAPGSKPLTFQIQGNKLTLTGTQVRQVTMPQPARQLPRNVVHLVSAGGQHHIISQPAQVALIQAMAQQAGQAPVGVQAVPSHQPPTILPIPTTSTAAAAVASTATITVPIAATQVPSSAVNSSGVVKIVVRQAPRDGLMSPSPGSQQPPLHPATPTTATALPGLPATLMVQRAPLSMNPVPPVRLPTQPLIPVRAPTPAPLQALVRPMLRMVQAPNPSMEQQLVTASPPPTVVPFAVTPAATIAASTSPTMVSLPISSPVPKEEPEILMLRSTTPTPPPPSVLAPRPRRQPPPPPRSPFYLESLEEKRKKQKEERLDRLFRLNEQHCNLVPIYGTEVLQFCTLFPPAPFSWEEEEESKEQTVAAQNIEKGWKGASYAHCYAAQVQRDPQHLEAYWQRAETLAQAILTPQQRIEHLTDIIERFIFVMPPVEAPAITIHTSHPPPSLLLQQAVFKETLRQELSPSASCLHRIVCNMRTQFPDLRLIQYDCGKLQTLDVLLRQLKTGAHRVLIFTQMTRMLDVLEQFLNYHGHIYLRLDGSTRIEQRQALMERFNADKRIFCFILSTRSGGVGVNLTGADTVVFYDSDWNPTMDAQAQDRCHRIGQTRDVHIYRLISERTVEENILKKANQKRMLGDMAIEGGNFTTAYFRQQTIRELFDMPLDEPTKKEGEPLAPAQEEEEDPMATKQTQILEQALCRAEDPEDIRAATQAKAEQVAELAEFNENIPLDTEDRPSKEEEEEMSKAEQEIASLVEQLTPIERYAMNFLEASLEDISREELKQAEEQVEAARKDIDQAKDEVVFKLPEDEDDSHVLEEVSSKKSKKAKVPNRITSERTGTRMSERLRNTRLLPRDGESGDVESSQTRLTNLRHPRIVPEEEDMSQHTQGAVARREFVREEIPTQTAMHTRRTAARREEPWNKSPVPGERGQRTASHRTDASGDRVLRTNPHRTEALPIGDKLLGITPQKPDPGAAVDRVLRGTPLRTETPAAVDRVLRGVQQRTDAGLDKVLRSGQQKAEKPPGLMKLHSTPPKPEALTAETQIPQLQTQGLGKEALRLKADVRECEEKEASQLSVSSPELQVPKNVPGAEVSTFQAQDISEVAEKLMDTQIPPEAGKVVPVTPASKEKAPSLVTAVAASESKLEVISESGQRLCEQKEDLPKPEENADENASCSTAEKESMNSLDDALRQESAQKTDCIAEMLSLKSTEGIPAGEAASRLVASKSTKAEVPVLASLSSSTAAASSLSPLDIPSFVKEQNGLEQPSKARDLPCPISNSSDEPRPEIPPVETALPAPETSSSESNSLMESSKQEVGGKMTQHDDEPNKAKNANVASICPEAVTSQESPSAAVICPGVPSSDESLSPIKTPRRRTSADVQILQSCQEQDGPAAKVLRKLPGRLVTVVEEKELIRRRRNRTRKLDLANSTMVSPTNSSAQSVSEPDTSPSSKELPLLRDLPARRRIEMESCAAAKEKDDTSRGEPIVSPSTEPIKRKRGRPPKNKSPEQQSLEMPQHLPEPASEISLPSKALEKKVPEIQPQGKSPERKVPEAPSPHSDSPKSKTESSENDSPVEKRRRGRPPKVRESPTMLSDLSASEILPTAPTKALITELLPKMHEQSDTSPQPASVKDTTPGIRESFITTPKSPSISRTSSKARNQKPLCPEPASAAKLTPKVQELSVIPPKPLSKSSAELCEPPAASPRAPSTAETFTEVEEQPSSHSLLCTSPKAALGPPAAESPPKRKRGRPPKNPPSPRVEAPPPPPPPTSTSDQETSTEKQTPAPPVRKRRRRRRKDELGPALPTVSQSSSEGEDTRPLTRLARLKREEKPESASEGLTPHSLKSAVTEGASSAESSTWEPPSGDTPTRSTRLRPGSLMPPLERETQRRKRRCSLEGSRVSNCSKSPAPQVASEQEGGESESSLRSSSESSGNKSAQQPKRQCCESKGGRGRGRGRWQQSGFADRILRSAAKPADNTRSASSPIPTRKTGPASTSAGGISGAPHPSSVPVTSSLSNRGRKPKT